MRSISVHNLADHVGQELGVSDWLSIDQQRIDTFARATGDHQWIHVDLERATRERGGTIAHGFLILSLIPVLHESVTEITDASFGLNYGLNRVRFIGPVAAGSRIRLLEKLVSVAPKQDGLLVTYEFVIEREGEDKPALIAESLGLIVP
jgi:acyl dehydratase